MKKLLIIFSAGCIFLLSSCSGKKEGGMTDKAKKNLETCQALAKMFESGDWSKVGDYIAADAVDHASMTGHDVVGIDSIKANFDQMSRMAGNFKNEVVKEMADDDYVFQWMKETSTMKMDDPMSGMKAGSTNSFNAIEVSKLKDGKIVEHWSFADWNDMMKMMQPTPATITNPLPETKDTMKHN